MHRQRHTRHSVAQMMMMIVNINRIHLHLTSKMWIRSCSRVFISAVRTYSLNYHTKHVKSLLLFSVKSKLYVVNVVCQKKNPLPTYAIRYVRSGVPLFCSPYVCERISIDMQLFHCSIFKFWITTWANALCVCVVYVCDTTIGCATANADNFVAI